MQMWTFTVSVLAGVMHGFSMAWPAFLWGDALEISGHASGLLQGLSMALLCALLLRIASTESPEKRLWLQGFWVAGLFATSAMASTWGWLYVSMHRYGGMPSWLAAVAVLSLAMALSVYFAAAGGVWVALFRRWILMARSKETRYAKNQPEYAREEFRHGLAGALMFAALWTLAELCRGQWLTGFPWGAAGYAHTDSLLATYLPWVGVYGVGAISNGFSMALPLMIAMWMAQRTQAWRGLAFVGLALAVLLPLALETTGTQFSQAAQTMKVRLLQGNIPQDEKFIPGQGVKLALNWYSEQLLNNPEPLVVTPETAIPVLPQQLPPAYWQRLQDKYAHANDGQQLALIGLPMGEAGAGYSNSVIAISPPAGSSVEASAAGAKTNTEFAYRYDKQHLVPFGEFVPPFFQWFVRLMNIPLGEFAHDRPAPTVVSWQGQRLLPQICYEDLFGEEVARYFANESEAPTVLVNMSNLAWFGDTTAAAQHLAISRIRALEFQRPVIRATNTGLTALIDDKGQVKAALPAFTRGALVGEFEGRTGLTPYAQWTSRWGLKPLWLICFAIVLVLGLFSRRSGARAL